MRNCRRLNLPALLVALGGVLISVTPMMAQTPIAYGSLELGPLPVGFRTIEAYDHSRSFTPKYDYFGNRMPGERARPLQVCVWYPAVAGNDASMVYGEYAFPLPDDDRFFNLVSNLQDRESQQLAGSLGRGYAADLMNVQMTAVRDARPDAGPHPLIIYHPEAIGAYCENAALCELLASYGFVVATTHSLANTGLNPSGDPVDLEALTRDKEFVLGALHDDPAVDRDRLGLLGYGRGGLTALMMQMRSTEVDAVVTLDGSYCYAENSEVLKSLPTFEPEQVRVPLLQAIRRDQPAYTGPELSFPYAHRYFLSLTGLEHRQFADYGLLVKLIPDTALTHLEIDRGYREICDYTLHFFQANLKSDEASRRFLDEPPESHGVDPEMIVVTTIPAAQPPPDETQFVRIILEEGVDTALVLFDQFRRSHPEHRFFQEAVMNALGYRHLQQGLLADAVALFRMNTLAYPGSANTWDSLSDAYIAVGKPEEALRCVNKSLEVLPADTTTAPDMKEAIKAAAEQKLEQLGG